MQANLSIAGGKPAKGQMKGWHALLWFIGFFGFMFAVNGIFLWTAITTFPGEDVEKSYLVGLDYNHELARRAHQTDAGWTAEIGLKGAAPGLTLRVRLTSKDGQPLPSSAARAELRHPADRNLDRILELTPAGRGEYTAAMPDVAAGRWDVQLSADIDPASDGMEFKAQKAVIVP